jgi:hypothetical protein
MGADRSAYILFSWRVCWRDLGVIHVIDKFLANPDYNGQAAASA